MFVFVMLFILILVGVLGVFEMDSLLLILFFIVGDLCLIFYKLRDCGLVYWFFFVFMDKVCFILIGFFIVLFLLILLMFF